MNETACPYCKSDLIATGPKYNGWIKVFCYGCNKEFVLNDSMVAKVEYEELVKQVLRMQEDIEYLQQRIYKLELELDDTDEYSEDSWLEEDEDE